MNYVAAKCPNDDLARVVPIRMKQIKELSLSHLSFAHEANPMFGSRVKPRTTSLWPLNVCATLPVFQSLIVLSAEPLNEES